MKCPDCGTGFNGKICPCGWKAGGTTSKSITGQCSDCQGIHAVAHLKNAILGKELCSTCFTIAQWEPTDREYYRTIARQNKTPLIDIPTHIQAANYKNMTLEEYLPTLPKTREQFAEYFKGGIKIGGIKL